MTEQTRPSAVVIGGGPAGLTAAYYLIRRNVNVTVLEQDHQVGGLARTVEYKGFRFDIGGHRFFTKVGPVRDLWHAMLGANMLTRPRLSRIYYNSRYFDYPLKAVSAFRGLGIIESFRVLLSYIWIRIRPIRPEVSFEDWVSNRFGRRLYGIFFKTYTEKVWGIPCDRIGAQWAAQRIKGLSLVTAVINMLFKRGGTEGGQIKTLIDEFEYPRLGPGMMWEAFQADIADRGGHLLLSAKVRGLHHHNGRMTGVEFERGGARTLLPADMVLSTMPLRELIESLSPAAPREVRDAAAALKYRDFLTIALILDTPDAFPDNWIYVHDPRVKLGRIQNFKNWSPEMVPDAGKTCLGLEYFCFEGDGLWTMSDPDLIALGTRELDAIGLLKGARVLDGAVVRMPKAYPVYDDGFVPALDVVRRYLDGFTNFQAAGRNGMHKYNNQDHSMVTAILAAQNLLGARHDVWAVNADDEYHEEGGLDVSTLSEELLALHTTQPSVPMELPRLEEARGGGR
ncbi:MAG TPA: NAD(P)/FAD-dependent oxidoreductase [Vicinamibacterales bacterium]|nr:NAD(P)/FAD-dependent oxidoreductase [Vicinamibacterales bacterium]